MWVGGATFDWRQPINASASSSLPRMHYFEAVKWNWLRYYQRINHPGCVIIEKKFVSLHHAPGRYWFDCWSASLTRQSFSRIGYSDVPKIIIVQHAAVTTLD